MIQLCASRKTKNTVKRAAPLLLVLLCSLLQTQCAYRWQGKTYYTKKGALEAQRESYAKWLMAIERESEPILGSLTVVIPSQEKAQSELHSAEQEELCSVFLESLVEGLKRRNIFKSVELVKKISRSKEPIKTDFILHFMPTKWGDALLLESPDWSGAWAVTSSFAVPLDDHFSVVLSNIENLAQAGSPANPHLALKKALLPKEESSPAEVDDEIEVVTTVVAGLGRVAGQMAQAETTFLMSDGYNDDVVGLAYAVGGSVDLFPWQWGGWKFGLRAGYLYVEAEESYFYGNGDYSIDYRAKFLSFHSIRGGFVLRRRLFGQLSAQLTTEFVGALGGDLAKGGLPAGYLSETPESTSFKGYGVKVGLGIMSVLRPYPIVVGVEFPYDYLRTKMARSMYADGSKESTLSGFSVHGFFGWSF